MFASAKFRDGVFQGYFHRCRLRRCHLRLRRSRGWSSVVGGGIDGDWIIERNIAGHGCIRADIVKYWGTTNRLRLCEQANAQHVRVTFGCSLNVLKFLMELSLYPQETSKKTQELGIPCMMIFEL